MSWKSQEEYISDSLSCPKCGSKAIEGGHVEIEDRGASQKVECLDCHAEWFDLYHLHGYEKAGTP